MSDQNGKELHLPQRAKSGEILRVPKNDRETIIFSLEVLEGITFLNAHTFIVQEDGKLFPTDKTSSFALTRHREAREQWDRAVLDAQQIKQALNAVEKELLVRGLISPFTDLPL